MLKFDIDIFLMRNQREREAKRNSKASLTVYNRNLNGCGDIKKVDFPNLGFWRGFWVFSMALGGDCDRGLPAWRQQILEAAQAQQARQIHDAWMTQFLTVAVLFSV